VGGGAHTGFIGEQAALCALAEGDLQRRAEAAADYGLGLKGILEYHAEGGGDVLDARYEYRKAAYEEYGRHYGHYLLGNGGKALHAAKEYEAADSHQHGAHYPAGYAEGGGAGGAYGVGLHHAAEEAQRKYYGYGKEASEELAEAALKGRGYVVDGAALYLAVLALYAGLLRQHGFRVYRRHAEEGYYPHPEYRAGATGEYRAGGAHDVARADLGGDSRGEGLEGAHAALMLFAVELEVAEYLLHALAEAAHLHEVGLYGVPEAYADKKYHQNIVRKIAVHCLNKMQQIIHSFPSPLLILCSYSCIKIINFCIDFVNLVSLLS